MSRSYETNADLVIAIQTLNTSLFKSVLYKVTVPITTLCDHCGANVFHEMAGILLPESVEIEFLSIFVTFCYKNYEENALDVLKICLNRQTATELLTPLMIATGNNKLVSII